MIKRFNIKIYIISFIVLFLVIFLSFSIIRLINKNTIISLQISSSPNKIEYFIGEELNVDGLKVYGLNKKNESVLIDLQDINIIGFNSGTENSNLEITLEYRELKNKFFVKIKKTPSFQTDISAIYVQRDLETQPFYKHGSRLQRDILIDYSLIIDRLDGSKSTITLNIYHIKNSEDFSNNLENEFTFEVVFEDAISSKIFETSFTITLID